MPPQGGIFSFVWQFSDNSRQTIFSLATATLRSFFAGPPAWLRSVAGVRTDREDNETEATERARSGANWRATSHGWEPTNDRGRGAESVTFRERQQIESMVDFEALSSRVVSLASDNACYVAATDRRRSGRYIMPHYRMTRDRWTAELQRWNFSMMMRARGLQLEASRPVISLGDQAR